MCGFELAEKYGFTFVGGPPMAGTHKSGFSNSSEDLCQGRLYGPGPRLFLTISVLLARVKKALEPAGFKNLTIATAEKHDRLIAFTSQMAHVVSNAYIKSPAALEHRGVSAGSTGI